MFFAAVAFPQETPEIRVQQQYKLLPSKDGGLPLDSRDNLPVIIGPTYCKSREYYTIND